jgi:hypothetical protein
MMQEMAEGVLPQDLLDIFGVEGYADQLGRSKPFYYVDPGNVDELNTELRRRGYEVLDGSEYSIQA